jgi:hypothetical protein
MDFKLAFACLLAREGRQYAIRLLMDTYNTKYKYVCAYRHEHQADMASLPFWGGCCSTRISASIFLFFLAPSATNDSSIFDYHGDKNQICPRPILGKKPRGSIGKMCVIWPT